MQVCFHDDQSRIRAFYHMRCPLGDGQCIFEVLCDCNEGLFDLRLSRHDLAGLNHKGCIIGVEVYELVKVFSADRLIGLLDERENDVFLHVEFLSY